MHGLGVKESLTLSVPPMNVSGLRRRARARTGMEGFDIFLVMRWLSPMSGGSASGHHPPARSCNKQHGSVHSPSEAGCSLVHRPGQLLDQIAQTAGARPHAPTIYIRITHAVLAHSAIYLAF